MNFFFLKLYFLRFLSKNYIFKVFYKKLQNKNLQTNPFRHQISNDSILMFLVIEE